MMVKRYLQHDIFQNQMTSRLAFMPMRNLIGLSGILVNDFTISPAGHQPMFERGKAKLGGQILPRIGQKGSAGTFPYGDADRIRCCSHFLDLKK
jgi:hypothetical protein